ncbi:ABC transporter ATP-binding protein [Bacillus methanolicus]|uniref:Putative ABC transporter ATP-binding protein YfiL n=1 Tax=Bacillus methanolicus (strain MGA3 / ATCC 53907) TaxID=796606 RepID=I3E7K7_BACMM|nr:ABC transporter ATP-binding protein [Bacillus methanolicus]AIE59303.1 putative ABC transporter ATP-binding protein YfiL [Bacillus methanolicus MGA3]EIJ82478.1 transposase [Bacillus methanolicus MGA3]
MLEVVNLSKHFKNKKAVNSVNLYLEKGETVGLLGPNGAGKSTTISMISSLIRPTEGDIRLGNNSILKTPQKLRKILGVVPQEVALYMELTARENLEFFGAIHQIPKQELRKRIEEVLEIIGLKDREKELVKTFSGGMKRRLNIGAALLHNPEIVIMDEPTVGIDPQSRNYILETVKRLNKEKKMTVLYTSHYMEEVEYLCDRIYIMDSGRIIASGTKEDIKSILSQEQSILIKVEMLKGTFLEALEQIPGIKNISAKEPYVTIIVPKQVHILKDIFKAAEETETNIVSVNIETPTLEDVFLHLTGRQLRD